MLRTASRADATQNGIGQKAKQSFITHLQEDGRGARGRSGSYGGFFFFEVIPAVVSGNAGLSFQF